MKDLDLYYGDDEKPFKCFKFTWYINMFVCVWRGVCMIFACEGSWCLKVYVFKRLFWPPYWEWMARVQKWRWNNVNQISLVSEMHFGDLEWHCDTEDAEKRTSLDMFLRTWIGDVLDVRKEENEDVEENPTVSSLCNWMDRISIGKLKNTKRIISQGQ